MKDIIEFSCGHEAEVDLYGPSSERNRYRKNMARYGLCPACEEKKEQEYYQKCCEWAEELGLPELTGSEKQKRWAASLRKSQYEEFQREIEAAERHKKTLPNDEQERYDRAVEFAVSEYFGKTASSYYIDNRDMGTREFANLVRGYMDKIADGSLNEVREVFSAEDHGSDVVDLKIDGGIVRLYYPKNEKFRQTVKAMGCTWDRGAWNRHMTAGAKSVGDLAADTVNELVCAGFAVSVEDKDVCKLLNTESWTPVNPLTIARDSERRAYRVSTGGREDVQNLALRLPRAYQWRGKAYENIVFVPFTATEEVADFADAYGFAWGANAARERDERMKARKTKLQPRTVEAPQINAKDLRRNNDLSDLIDAD